MNKVYLLYYDMDNNEKIIRGVFSSELLANKTRVEIISTFDIIYGKYVIIELEMDKIHNSPLTEKKGEV